MKKWILLACAILSEVTGSLSLKAALGHPGWYALVVAGFFCAFMFLALVLRERVPLGVAYGIWGASGVALTAILSTLIYGEPLTPIMVGGLIRLWVEKRKFKSEERRQEVINDGVLYASGMIAGEGLVGILLAVFAVLGLSDKINLGGVLGNIGGVVFFVILIAIMLFFMFGGKKKSGAK